MVSVPGPAIDFFRVNDLPADNIPVKRSEKAAAVSGMAGSTGLLNFVEEAVLVAVHEDLYNFLEMAALLAFLPEFFPAPAKVMGIARRLREVHCLLVCVCHHEDIPGFCILHDHRDQPPVREPEGKHLMHHR